MYPHRTKIKKDIIVEFLPPKNLLSDKIIIFAPGMPSSPTKDSLLNFWVKKGYWVFLLRYRGTWESGGSFLEKSPHVDILDLLDEIPRGLRSVFTKKDFKCNYKKVYIIGNSFGGAAALLAAKDKRVTKVVCISPLVDWLAPSEDEPLDEFEKTLKDSFGEAYRFRSENWKKLSSGKFFNPIYEVKDIPGSKILIYHCKDEKVVDPNSVEDFAKKSGSTLIMKKTGGHLSSSFTKKFFVSRKIHQFFHS